MRPGARFASTKRTLLTRSSTTSWTTDGEYLFLAEFFFHGSRDTALNPCTKMVNLDQLWQLLPPCQAGSVRDCQGIFLRGLLRERPGALLGELLGVLPKEF
jgi:hypothetical protein